MWQKWLVTTVACAELILLRASQRNWMELVLVGEEVLFYEYTKSK